MEHKIQVELIDRVLALVAKKSTHMADEASRMPVEPYISHSRFHQEIDLIFKRCPIIIAHSSELPNSGDFLTFQHSNMPMLIVRNDKGNLNAFINVCRHRGTKLAMESRGCGKRAFICPYHAWTYNQEGKLLHIPQSDGFPDAACQQLDLVALPIAEKYGFIWVIADPNGAIDFDQFIDPIKADLTSFAFDTHSVYQPATVRKVLNWKVGIEIFLEAYHIKQAHKSSIYPLFFDNVGLFDRFHPHLRNIFPKRKIIDLANIDKNEWNLRNYANILYLIFPNAFILVEMGHATLFTIFPDGIDHTIILTKPLLPALPDTEKATRHWQKNIDILNNATSEDFAMGESIQQGFHSGANQYLQFGRYEQSLRFFHETVEETLTKK